MYELADIAYDQEDFETFFSAHQSHAEKGDLYSQYNVGWAYQHGLGVPRDRGKAKNWYLKAAQQGHADAQYQLGLLLGKDSAIYAVIGMDTFWYEQAAMNGHVKAAYRLAQAYEQGLGVPEDQQLASEWFMLPQHHRSVTSQYFHPRSARSGLVHNLMDVPGAWTGFCGGVGFENPLPRHVTSSLWGFFYFNSAPVPLLIPTGCKSGRFTVTGRGASHFVGHRSAKGSSHALGDFVRRVNDHVPTLKGGFNLLPSLCSF